MENEIYIYCILKWFDEVCYVLLIQFLHHSPDTVAGDVSMHVENDNTTQKGFKCLFWLKTVELQLQ